MFEFLENNDLGDLNRYRLLMNQLEPVPEYRTLVHALREERGNGRNDYTDETMVRVLIVKNLFQLGTDAQVRRELLRNSQLRHLVGLSDIDAGLRSSNHHSFLLLELLRTFSGSMPITGMSLISCSMR